MMLASISNTLQDIQNLLLINDAQHSTLTMLCSWKWTLCGIEPSKSVIATGNFMNSTVLIPTLAKP